MFFANSATRAISSNQRKAKADIYKRDNFVLFIRHACEDFVHYPVFWSDNLYNSQKTASGC